MNLKQLDEKTLEQINELNEEERKFFLEVLKEYSETGESSSLDKLYVII